MGRFVKNKVELLSASDFLNEAFKELDAVVGSSYRRR